MIMTHKFRPALAGVLAILFFNACSGESADGGMGGSDGLLQYVPADTPYLLVTGETFSDEFYDRYESDLDKLLGAYRGLLSESYKSALAQNTGDMSAAEMARMSAVADQLLSLVSIDGMRNAGFERDSQMVFYGNGLLPVLRIQVSDTAKFEKAIADLEEAAGEDMQVGEVGGNRYRYVGDDELHFVVGEFGGEAVFTLMPAKFDDEQAKSLLGITAPAKSIASTTVVSDIQSKYGFSDHYVGFIDTVRLASTFVEPATGLNAAIMDLAEFDTGSISAVCKKEIMEVAGIAPRAVFGYNNVDLPSMEGSFVVELRKDLATGLTGVAAEVPGLGIDNGALLAFGASVNLLAWREFYEARLDAMEAKPYECEYFADMQAGVAKGREMLAQPIPPVAYGIRGFNAVIDSLGDFDLANKVPPENIDASLLFALEDASALVAMGTMFSPELAQLGLVDDGAPVSISSLPQVAAVAQEAFAAMLPNGLAVSLGADAKKRVTEVLKADIVNPIPVIGMSMDAGEYYKLLADGMEMTPDDADAENEMSAEAQESAREIMRVLGEFYDRMLLNVTFTEHGMEIRSKVTLKE